MKNLFKAFLLLTISLAVLASCSKSDDYDYEKAQEQQRIQDSLNNVRVQKLLVEQAPELEKFAKEKFDSPILNDSSGIWYEVTEPGEGPLFQYIVSNNGINAPTVTVKYKGTLLDGTVFDETKDGKPAEFSLGGLIHAWQLAFLPEKIRYNGNDYPVNGLTKDGLRKGSKIRFVTPSPWAYDASTREKIPANSPLYFEIEVIDIEYK